MPTLSLEELDEILKHYSAQEPLVYPKKIDKINRSTCTVVPLLIDNHEKHLQSTNELGAHALAFISLAQERYQLGMLSPPLNAQNIAKIFEFLLPLNKDLTGCLNGEDFEIQRAHEWNTHWSNLITTIHNEGHQLTIDEISLVQNDILCTYRQKIIQHCSFKPKGADTFEVDDIRVQEYLSSINQCIGVFSPTDAFEHLHAKYLMDFENDLGLDIQALSRYLNTQQQTEYLKKFEEIICRKAYTFVGEAASTKLFKEMTKDSEFIRQLPSLIEKSQAFKNFILHYPNPIRSEQHL